MTDSSDTQTLDYYSKYPGSICSSQDYLYTSESARIMLMLVKHPDYPDVRCPSLSLPALVNYTDFAGTISEQVVSCAKLAD